MRRLARKPVEDMMETNTLLIEQRARIVVTVSFGLAIAFYAFYAPHSPHDALSAAIAAIFFALVSFVAARLTSAIARQMQSSSWGSVITAHLAAVLILARVARAVVR